MLIGDNWKWNVELDLSRGLEINAMASKGCQFWFFPLPMTYRVSPLDPIWPSSSLIPCQTSSASIIIHSYFFVDLFVHFWNPVQIFFDVISLNMIIVINICIVKRINMDYITMRFYKWTERIMFFDAQLLIPLLSMSNQPGNSQVGAAFRLTIFTEGPLAFEQFRIIQCSSPLFTATGGNPLGQISYAELNTE